MTAVVSEIGDVVDPKNFAYAIDRRDTFYLILPLYTNVNADRCGEPIEGDPIDLRWAARLTFHAETISGNKVVQFHTAKLLYAGSGTAPALLLMVVLGPNTEIVFEEGNGEAFRVQVQATDNVQRLETIAKGVVFVRDAASGGIF